MKKAKVALVSMLMLAGSGVYAQTNGIGGTVTDNTGEPIIGASVKVKGTTNQGTVTDIDGNFKLNVKPGETLVISYIGCKDQEVKAGDNLKIVLQDNSEVLGRLSGAAQGRPYRCGVCDEYERAGIASRP